MPPDNKKTLYDGPEYRHSVLHYKCSARAEITTLGGILLNQIPVNSSSKKRLAAWTPGSVMGLLILTTVLSATLVPLSIFLIRLALGN